MLITFSSDVYPDVVLFGDVAKVFLKIMGERDEPPGILRGENIRLAAERLQTWLGTVPEEKELDSKEEDAAKDDDAAGRKNPVGLRKRAFPLLELLEIAYRKGSDVIWR